LSKKNNFGFLGGTYEIIQIETQKWFLNQWTRTWEQKEKAVVTHKRRGVDAGQRGEKRITRFRKINIDVNHETELGGKKELSQANVTTGHVFAKLGGETRPRGWNGQFCLKWKSKIVKKKTSPF